MFSVTINWLEINHYVTASATLLLHALCHVCVCLLCGEREREEKSARVAQDLALTTGDRRNEWSIARSCANERQDDYPLFKSWNDFRTPLHTKSTREFQEILLQLKILFAYMHQSQANIPFLCMATPCTHTKCTGRMFYGIQYSHTHARS